VNKKYFVRLSEEEREELHAVVGTGKASARKLRRALPKKQSGDWLNFAEIEFRVLSGQCLDRRIPDRATLEREVAAWEADRNARSLGVDWQFTTEDARVKLKRLYPVFKQA